jgi:hypothetical protein
MVAKINEPIGFRTAICYNEKKVGRGVAELIDAGNYLKAPEDLSRADKIQRFDMLAQRHKSITRNTLHIALSFDLSERVSREKLAEIAGVYMEKIGFGDQPYLVYQHHDAKHSHIHIVTINIREDGTPIQLHNIGRNQSRQARMEITKEYGLVPAGRNTKDVILEIEGQDAHRMQYGKSDVLNGITHVLHTVLKD